MPLTKTGENILDKFNKKYGKEKGEDNFYAYMNKFQKRTKSWHKE